MGEIADSIIGLMIHSLPSYRVSRNCYRNANDKELCDFDLYVEKITEKAILALSEKGYNLKAWLPISMIRAENLKEREFNKIKIPRWLSKEKGL